MSSDNGPVFESKECIAEISKIIVRGQIRRIGEPKYDICDSPSCRSFKAKHNFSCILRTNEGCDSKLAKILDGLDEPTSRPNFTSEITHGLILNGEGRGAHSGKFHIVGSEDTNVTGILTGITNAGTHHTFSNECETCNVKGHMEGRLVGKITKGSLVGSRIFASYMIRFEHSPEFNDTIAAGTLEGIIVSDCT